jgi:hypothetical protein
MCDMRDTLAYPARRESVEGMLTILANNRNVASVSISKPYSDSPFSVSIRLAVDGSVVGQGGTFSDAVEAAYDAFWRRLEVHAQHPLPRGSPRKP